MQGTNSVMTIMEGYDCKHDESKTRRIVSVQILD